MVRDDLGRLGRARCVVAAGVSLLMGVAGCGGHSTVTADDPAASNVASPTATDAGAPQANGDEICALFVSMFVPGDPESGAAVEVDAELAVSALDRMIPLAPPDLRDDLVQLAAARAVAADPDAQPSQDDVTAAYQADRRMQEWMEANCDLSRLFAEAGLVPEGDAPMPPPSPDPERFEPVEGSIEDL